MKIEINVPKNGYKQPTEIRETVVQGVVSALFMYIKDERPFKIRSFNEGLYLHNGGIYYKRQSDDDVRINGAEMNAAFTALHEAGYYLYGSYCITDMTHAYVWSCKPQYGNYKPQEEPTFNVFID